MLNANYSSNPYDTTRPKAFFGDRKKLYVEEITRGSGGKSYNSSWNAHRKPINKKITDGSKENSIVLMINAWSFYAGVILMSLIFAT